MAQPRKPVRKQGTTNIKKPPAYNPKATTTSLFDSLDNWFNKRSNVITIIAFSCCLLFSLLLFQARMDIGGDDSGYILRAYDFIHKGEFPSWQGPLFPMILSIFIALFGIKIVMLKFISWVFNFFALVFLYKAFKGRVPALIFYSVLILTALNAYILSFASLTYSEACFQLIQALIFFYFFKLQDKINGLKSYTLKDTYKDFLLVGLFAFLLSLSRSVGLFALPGLLLYFLFRKEFKGALYLIGSFAAFYILFEIAKKFIFHVTAEWGAERSVLLLKDQYNPSAGYETISGFGTRFIGNAQLYMSKRFFQVIGLRSPDATDVSGGLTFFFIVLCIFALYRAFKSKNSYVLSVALYTGAMLGATFLAAQMAIDQPRLVMVYVPFLLFIFLFAAYDALKKSPWVGQSVLMYVIIILLVATCVSTFSRTKDNIKVLNKNFHGDIYYGFTPDWANYIKMSQWCADSLPANAMVATRKAEISFMYTNKEIFYPVYKVYSTDPDSVLDFFKRKKVNYVMLASLRGNPKVADGNIITTLWRMMQPVDKKYPQKVRLVHQEGTIESAFLYQVVY